MHRWLFICRYFKVSEFRIHDGPCIQDEDQEDEDSRCMDEDLLRVCHVLHFQGRINALSFTPPPTLTHTHTPERGHLRGRMIRSIRVVKPRHGRRNSDQA